VARFGLTCLASNQLYADDFSSIYLEKINENKWKLINLIGYLA